MLPASKVGQTPIQTRVQAQRAVLIGTSIKTERTRILGVDSVQSVLMKVILISKQTALQTAPMIGVLIAGTEASPREKVLIGMIKQ